MKGKRKRRTAVLLAVLLIVVLAVIASGVGAVAKFRSDCGIASKSSSFAADVGTKG